MELVYAAIVFYFSLVRDAGCQKLPLTTQRARAVKFRIARANGMIHIQVTSSWMLTTVTRGPILVSSRIVSM